MDDLGSRAWSYGPGEFPTPWKEECLVKGRYPAHVDLDTISTAAILAVLMLCLRHMSQARRQGLQWNGGLARMLRQSSRKSSYFPVFAGATEWHRIC